MSAPLSEQRLAEIAARDAAATPGPWRAMVIDADVTTVWAGGNTVHTAIRIGRAVSPKDGAFIAAARTDVPALLAEVERLTARVAELEAERDGKPNRFTATPLQVDVHLRSILAEDTYLRYQQAIGSEAVREAMDDATAYRNSDDNAAKKQAWRSGIDDALGHVDPDGDGAHYPSQLLCSQHNGFGPCPGAPWCTPAQASTEAGGPMTTPISPRTIADLDVPAEVLLERLRLSLPVTDPDRHALDTTDTHFARLAPGSTR